MYVLFSYLIYIFFIIIVCTLNCMCQTQVSTNHSDTQDISVDPNELLNYLTQLDHYDKYTSPFHSFLLHKTDIIFIRIHIYYIKNIPAENVAFLVHSFIQLRWKDPRLKYDDKIINISSLYGEVDILNKIWTPDIYLENERASLIRGPQNKDFSLQISPNGTVLYSARFNTVVNCWIKIGRFPLEDYKCDLDIDTWKFAMHELLLKWENSAAVSVGKYVPFSTEYRLLNTYYSSDLKFTESQYTSNHVHNSSSLKVTFHVTRNYGFYIMNYYVPSLLVVILSWVAFWEAPDAVPGRTLLGTASMLTIIIIGVDVSKSLPVVSYIRSNDLWFLGCTAFIFCSLAEFAFVNTLWRYGGRVELKKATSKYILKKSLAVKSHLKPRRRSISCPSSPTGTHREFSPKKVINNELTVKSLSDLEISIPLSEISTPKREIFEICEEESKSTTTMSMQEIAVWIDKKSRVAFPACFLVFLFAYWGLVFYSCYQKTVFL